LSKVHPFFTKPLPSQETDLSPFNWRKSLGIHGTCLHGINLKPVSSTKVAAFDLDGTLIKGLKGSLWEWWREVVPSRLKELHDEG
jgi:bifunctional polynucleotide phosphatase/kinase